MENHNQILTTICLLFLSYVISLSCQKNEISPDQNQHKPSPERVDIGLEELLTGADVVVNVSQSSRAVYQAIARARGTVPAGEYAGRRFIIQIEATYSDVGLETLIAGRASVRIGPENYVSVTSPDFDTFVAVRDI